MKQFKNRPQSAKVGDFQPVSAKRKTAYPTTNKPTPPSRPQVKSKVEQDLTFLAKMRPRVIQIDKEKLYEDNMALKLKMNAQSEEMIRLKTKLNQSERENSRKDEIIDELRNQDNRFQGGKANKNNHLVASLKSSIRELRLELVNKTEENLKLKQNIKTTKGVEMEIEIQAYIDECTRLRHHIEELMHQRENTQSSQEISSLEEKLRQQNSLYNNLKKENQEYLYELNENKQEISK